MVGPNNLNGVVDDAFGYLSSLAHVAAKTKMMSMAAWKGEAAAAAASATAAAASATSLMKRSNSGSSSGDTSSTIKRSPSLTESGMFNAAKRRLSKAPSMSNMLPGKEEDSVTLAAKSAAREVALEISVDEEKGNTPWRHGHKLIMNKLVPG